MNAFVDAHCDTITTLMRNGEELLENKGHLDLKRMKSYGAPVQVFAIWLEPIFYSSALHQTVKAIDFYYDQIEKNNTLIGHCNSFSDIRKNKMENRISSILSLEGGEALEGDLSMVRIFYQLGVRGITLTWNHRNQLADGVAETETKGGLTQFGKEVIREMNRLGMLVDVSHLSDGGFWDVVKETKAPFIASHSNSRAICNHPRNLTEEQMKAIGEKGGVIGLNFYSPFLSHSVPADLESCLSHLSYMTRKAGTDAVGLGGDFDGMDQPPVGLEEVSGMEVFFDRIRKRFGTETAEKIISKNFLRVFQEVLQEKQ